MLTNPDPEADMARIDKQAVLSEATEAARRVQFVRKDPAVIKAAKQAGQDLVQASVSFSALVAEVKGSWARSE